VAITLDKLRSSMSEYNVTRAIRGNRNYRNAVDFCLGVSDASRFFMPTDSDDSLGCKRTNLITHEQSKFMQLIGACLFCEYSIAWKISQTLHQFSKVFGGSIWPSIALFYRGMAATSILHSSKSRQYIRAAKSCLKKIRKGFNKSRHNLSHQLNLLEAEYAAFRKKDTTAERHYLLAIEHASLAGVTHEHAYACERFGTYYLLRKDHAAAYRQIREAHRLYSKWGKALNCLSRNIDIVLISLTLSRFLVIASKGSRPKCEQLKKKFPRLDEKDL